MTYTRFDDNDKVTRSNRRALDVFEPFRDVLDAFVSSLGKYYTPGPLQTVDEQLVPFRGRCSFLQCLPSKPTYSQNNEYKWQTADTQAMGV